MIGTTLGTFFSSFFSSFFASFFYSFFSSFFSSFLKGSFVFSTKFGSIFEICLTATGRSKSSKSDLSNYSDTAPFSVRSISWALTWGTATFYFGLTYPSPLFNCPKAAWDWLIGNFWTCFGGGEGDFDSMISNDSRVIIGFVLILFMLKTRAYSWWDDFYSVIFDFLWKEEKVGYFYSRSSLKELKLKTFFDFF